MGTKIAIGGIGGVGGYYGGLLAKNNVYNSDVDVYFIARGAHLKKIQQLGLTVKTEAGTFIAQPKLATDKPAEIGVVDYVILATKSYDLEESIEQIKPCISKNTVILPLLNGADITPRIRRLLPDNEVWYGCVYIVGRITDAGIVETTGNIHSLFFGNTKTNDKLLYFERILKEAKIEATLSDKILSTIWTKFAFISSTASLTSYFDCTFGGLLEDKHIDVLKTLLAEFLQIANAEGVDLDESVIDKTISRLEALPYATTSSMHSDFKAQKRTEVDLLTGFMVELAKKHGITAPVYEKVYAALTKMLVATERE